VPDNTVVPVPPAESVIVNTPGAANVGNDARECQDGALIVDDATRGEEEEVVGEGQVAETVSLESATVEKHRAGADRTVVGHLHRGVGHTGAKGIGISAGQYRGAQARRRNR